MFLARSFPTFLSFRSLLIPSVNVFLNDPLEKLPLTLKVVHLQTKYSLPFFLEDQTMVVFYPVNIL